MKKLLLLPLLAIIAVAGFFIYRAAIPAISDRDGNQLRYTYSEVMEQGITGIFVKNADGTFSPAIKQMPNYQGMTEASSPSRFVWYPENDKSVSELIPIITKGTNLVAIFDRDGDLPRSHYLEKYKYKGYTIGLHIEKDANMNLVLKAENYLPGSQAAGILSSMSDNTNNEYLISEISGSENLPLDNIDPNMELLLGLQGGKLYEIKYFHGTKGEKQTFKADSRVFQSEKYIPLTTPYTKTDEGYFIINLPDNLTNGYYYLSDMGFFAVDR